MMTNQVNQEFEKWYENKRIEINATQGWTNHSWAEQAYQAATQASEQRIKELEELAEGNAKLILELLISNNRLRETLEVARDYQAEAVGIFHANMAGYNEHEHIAYDADLANTDKAIASTPTQSLAEHDNELLANVEDLILEMLGDTAISKRIVDAITEFKQ